MTAAASHSARFFAEASAGVLDAPPSSSRARAGVAVVAALALHGASIWLASSLGRSDLEPPPRPITITELVDLPAETVSAPQPANLEASRVPPPSAAPKPTTPRRAPAAKAPPPVAAPASAVSAAREEVVDFSEHVVANQGTAFTGGVVARAGAAGHAVVAALARDAAGDGETLHTASGDLSRGPKLVEGARWDCPFPDEADAASIDHATVTLRIEVARDGRVDRVEATDEPGHGFGREAMRCARSKHWQPAIDRAGGRAGAVAIVHVKFDR